MHFSSPAGEVNFSRGPLWEEMSFVFLMKNESEWAVGIGGGLGQVLFWSCQVTGIPLRLFHPTRDGLIETRWGGGGGSRGGGGGGGQMEKSFAFFVCPE